MLEDVNFQIEEYYPDVEINGWDYLVILNTYSNKHWQDRQDDSMAEIIRAILIKEEQVKDE